MAILAGMSHPKDVFVITYGSKFAIRFQTGVNLKLLKTLEEAIESAWIEANRNESEVYIEDAKGKRRKAKRPPIDR